MSVINTGVIAKMLAPGLNARWGASYTEHAKHWNKLVDVHSSDKAYEEDLQVGTFGLAPVKPQGEPTYYDTMTQGVTQRYTHVAYSLGFPITHEALVDNQYEKIGMQRTGGLAFSMRQTKENVVANIYNRAFNSSYVGADGKELLATDHPSSGGNWSNELTTAADFSEASVEDLIGQIMAASNDRGLKIAIMPQTLIVPTGLWAEAARVINSTGQSGNANNDLNVLNGVFPGGIIVNPYLTDTDAWFIRTNVDDGLKLFQREEATFKQDGDFDTDNLKYKAYERYSAGWTDPHGLYGSPGA